MNMLPYSSKKQHVGGGVQHKILFVFGIILALSCQPQGQLERHIHAPHLSFLADPKPGFQKHLNAESRAHTQDQAGIPSSCQIENRDKTSLCITCMPDDFIVERCYRFQGQLDILSSCAYSQEHLKCLQRDPTLAINLNFKRSLEKELIEHINTWQESLSSIALNQFDEPQKIEFNKATHWTMQLLLELIKLHGVEPWTEENLLARLAGSESSPEQIKKLSELLKELQTERTAGRLKLQEVLRASQSWLATAGYSKTILAFWEALSLEGLEDEL